MKDFYHHTLNNFRRLIIFCCPGIDENKLTVCHPPSKFGDISTNALRFLPEWYFKEDFIDGIKMFVPNEKIEVRNGMLNIWFPVDDLIKVAKINSLKQK